MTGARRFLTFGGVDVAPIYRRADGRTVVVYLDRHGRPTTATAEAWPHELRGLGWHLSEIKRLLEQLPAEAPAPCRGLTAAIPPQPSSASRPFLHAHFTAPKED